MKEEFSKKVWSFIESYGLDPLIILTFLLIILLYGGYRKDFKNWNSLKLHRKLFLGSHTFTAFLLLFFVILRVLGVI